MRIVCIHIPYISLQALVRTDGRHAGEHRADVPMAVAGTVRGALGLAPSVVVVGCNRAAYARGVRAGMSVSVARALGTADAPISIEPADTRADEQLVDAVADLLLGMCPVVDRGAGIGAHHAVYATLPPRSRGESFGAKVLAALDQLGVRGRIGIADDRFTAWAAAATHHTPPSVTGQTLRMTDEVAVCSVPRGGSAAFLAPLPVAVLGIAPEVESVLHELHVHTVGAFASLPAPSVSRPLSVDYQALARGEGGNELRPYRPCQSGQATRTIAEAARLGDTVLATIEMLAERISRRLAGRGRRAVELQLRMGVGDAARSTVVPVPEVLAQRGAAGLIEAVSRSLPQAIASIGTWIWLDVVADGPVGDAEDGDVDAALLGATGASGATGTGGQVLPVHASSDEVALPPLALASSGNGADEGAHDGQRISRVTSSFFQLQPTGGERRDDDFRPRRSHRGKHRPRIAPSVQGRLFRS